MPRISLLGRPSTDVALQQTFVKLLLERIAALLAVSGRANFFIAGNSLYTGFLYGI